MNRRLWKVFFLTLLLPLVTILLSFSLWRYEAAQLGLLLVSSFAQVTLIRMGRRSLEELIHPTEEVMTLMHTERIPAPYEPDRFKWDLKFACCAMYLGVPAPLLAFLAKAWPFLDPTPARTAATVSYPLLFAALGCALAGAAFLAFWARLAQAAAIGDEISEKKRYQLRGFAELIDRPGMVAEYRTLARRMGVAFPW